MEEPKATKIDTSGQARNSVTYLSRVWMMLGIALTLVALSSPYWQSLRPFPLQGFERWSPEWWWYPGESNPWKRLPVIADSLNGLHVHADGKRLWVVTYDGTIRHTEDGGKTWRQQYPALPEQKDDQASTGWQRWSLMGAAYAEEAASDYDEEALSKVAPANAAASPGAATKLPQEPPQLTRAPLPSQAPEAINIGPQTDVASAPAKVRLNDIVFSADGLKGWAVGDRGTVLRSVDAGNTWLLQRGGSEASYYEGMLRKVRSSEDGLSAWVVGSQGTVLSTRDGGENWRVISLTGGRNELLNSISVQQGGRLLWAVGSGGGVYHSNDAGNLWSKQYSGNLLFDVVFMPDSQRGWAVGAEVIIATQDGGKTWIEQPIPEIEGDIWFNSIGVADDGQHLWVAGNEGVLLNSDNAGQTWQLHETISSSWLNEVQFQDGGQSLWIAGSQGTLLHSPNGGVDWQAVTAGDQAFFRTVSFAPDGLRGWLGGRNGALLHTQDAGRTWVAQASGTLQTLEAMQVAANGRDVWGIAKPDLVLMTGDAGAHWHIRNLGEDIRLGALAVQPGGQLGWVGGFAIDKESETTQGVVLTTRDGGLSWRKETFGPGEINALAADSQGQRVWASSRLGQLLRSWNAGADWQREQILQSSDGAVEAAMLRPELGKAWLVADRTDVLVFSAAPTGKSSVPQRQFSAHTETPFAAAMQPGGRSAWIVGWEGLLLHSSDGERWQEQDSATLAGLRDVAVAPDGLQAWLVGDAATLRYTQDGGRSWFDPSEPPQTFAAPWSYVAGFIGLGLLLYGISVWQQQKLARASNADSIADLFVSDRPLQDAENDRLGHREIAEGISKFLRNSATTPRLTLAITGPWGSGKSSIMNLLKADLRAQGFRPVWYNAWHHQNEPSRLASLFASIRRQAVPSGLSVSGWRFRLGLLWAHGWRLRLLAILLFGLIAFSISNLAQLPGDKWQRLQGLWDNFWGLNPNLVLPVEGATADKLAETFGEADLQKIREQLIWPDWKVQGTACELQYQYQLHGENQRETQCRFRSVFDLQLALESKPVLGRPLTKDELQGVGSALVQVSSEHRLLAFEKLASLLAALIATSLVFIKGFGVLGVSAAQLFRLNGSARSGNERTGYRADAKPEYQRLTRVLGRRLVVFIDDLDRCRCDTIMQTLEAVNFLIDSGDCFVVLGMDPDYVIHCVGHEFSGQVDDGDVSADPAERLAKRHAFARRYLEKLVNIEVPVPDADQQRLLALIDAQETAPPEIDKGSALDSLASKWTKAASWVGEHAIEWVPRLMWLLLGGVIIWAGAHLATPVSLPEFSPLAEQGQAQTSDPDIAPVPPISRSDAVTQTDFAEAAQSNVEYKPAQPTQTRLQWEWLLIALLAALLWWIKERFQAAQGLLGMIARRLQQALRKLSGAVGQVNEEQDSVSFRQALDQWSPHVLAAGDNANPRRYKRFVNRVRFIAMRNRALPDQHPARLDRDDEDLLVELTACDAIVRAGGALPKGLDAGAQRQANAKQRGWFDAVAAGIKIR